MKYYALGQIDVTDPAWIREYVTQVTAIVQRREKSSRARLRANSASSAMNSRKQPHSPRWGWISSMNRPC